jgi:iron complex transport system substrate-binding protein
MRVASLLPAATELLCFLGARELLIARSHECDFPPDIGSLPVLTRPLIDPGPAPEFVNQPVREAPQTGTPGSSLYTLDVERLVGLRPDLILMQDPPNLAAIDLHTLQAAICRLDPAPRILRLEPQTIEDVFEDLLRIGQAFGRESAAAAALVSLRERFFRAADYVPPFAAAPVVAFLESTEPLIIGGRWIPQLLERAGAAHPLNPTRAVAHAGAAAGPMQASRRAGASVRLPPEMLAAVNPACLIVCPRGVVLHAVREATAALAQQPWWPGLPAVRNRRIAIVDGSQMFSRPGPRLVDAYQWLVGWLNDRPDLIPADFPWEPWSS